VVIDKEDAQARKGIFMIDASGGFQKDGPKNRLRSMDIHKIVEVFNRCFELPKVSFEEIEKNDFNLNLPRYIDSQRQGEGQGLDLRPGSEIPRRLPLLRGGASRHAGIAGELFGQQYGRFCAGSRSRLLPLHSLRIVEYEAWRSSEHYSVAFA
jgi:type I restriction-modification system DNA methylase subunit